MMWCSGNLHRHKEGEATAVLPAGQQLTSKRSFAAGRQGFTNWACPPLGSSKSAHNPHIFRRTSLTARRALGSTVTLSTARGAVQHRGGVVHQCLQGWHLIGQLPSDAKEGGFRLQCTGWVREVERITRHTFRDHGGRHITNSATRSDIGHVELWPAQEHVHPALCFFSASVGQLCRTVQPPLRAR